jgi:Flp pilus assembly protein TadG
MNGGLKQRWLRLGVRASRVGALVAAFKSNRRGNVAVICGLAAVPLVTAIGCVIDYSMASLVKTKLQAAADAASLAAVSYNSSLISTAQNMSGNGTVSGGSTVAIN